MSADLITCPTCAGRGRRLAPVGGYYPYPSRTCADCAGSGRVEATSDVVVWARRCATTVGLFWLYCRGVLYVSLQALLVSAIAAFHLPAVFAVGALISFVWTGNVQAQAGAGMAARIAYSLGAGSGAVLGMIVGGWLK